ncbi:hypothetical protein [Aquisalinus flavus]|uniref:Uncharacterized protein n=1 Tax=Aquisalinus flavus TaxID=1526572 RepID=A0A8J2V2B7_9PROT|nr:hypothetical protein [Aquisalinus flavus]MBD0425221.1 hypothetical protein [Aquisalinus flavus]UNE49118.1 hypothetical protein FF099_14190 [Aquisalinus flavus]GGD17760.1 hypothetical protein GCM10011342_28240 [Aquisalinus flavus]
MAVSDQAETGYMSDSVSVSERTGTPRLSRSRMAVIALTDRLARRAMPGFVLVFVAAICLSLYHLPSAPGLGAIIRILLWLGMSLSSIWIVARRLRRYRMGGLIASRPLTWRAGHTAGLGIISTALGCGSLMLSATAAPVPAAVTILILTALTLVLALGNIAHARAALSAALPALILTGFAGAQAYTGTASPAAMILVAAAALTVLAAVWGVIRNRRLVAIALDQHPRHEIMAISARRKKTTSAYNPFKMKATRAAPAAAKSSVTSRPFGRVKLYTPRKS